ncbi:MAG: threonine--tRNA ligase [Deltaproteobacteria bacterium]|nr:threonine--tRNA ligase [Deltaproteobacteria bacterium]
MSAGTIRIAKPTGEFVDVEVGTTAVEALRALGERRLGEAIAAAVDDRVVDLSRPIEGDAAVRPIFPDSREGLEVIRHSTAHLMAHAVKRLFPETQVTIGPVIESGFYYDFKYARPFTPEDLERIEKVMQEIAGANLAVERREVSKPEAVAFFRELGEDYKVEIIESIADDRVSLYAQGDFTDLCRGPHVPSTGRLKAFKLTSVAGAYWRGSEKNEMLQRIYGTAFASPKELKAHLAMLEEAKRRDHRRLGRDLNLFSFHPEAPASPFFHPKGALVYNELIAYIRRLYDQFGYQEVLTPQVLDVELWKRSGHYDNYRDNMYFTEADERAMAVKPMNCPSHCLLYGMSTRSYRDLPMRLADFGRLHRYERSGVTAGLTRVRSFSQDDAHIFCTPDQIEGEVGRVIDMLFRTYDLFGFAERRIYLGTRPEKSTGSDAMWERAESTLARVLQNRDIAYELHAGDGAFYGPKIDFCILDAMRREWQLGTVQLDFSMPERFDLHFVNSAGEEERPVMIHRALLGSIERFMAILIEHCAGDFPLWLAPVQMRLVTVTEDQHAYADDVLGRLRAAGLRAEADVRKEKLGYKIREAELQKVPFVLVVGDKEVATGTVAPRRRGAGTLASMAVAELIEVAMAEIRPVMGGGVP